MKAKIRPLVKSPFLPKLRPGKGFSKKELEAVGLTPEKAKKLGIPYDKRRKSFHEHNVKILREYLEKLAVSR